MANEKKKKFVPIVNQKSGRKLKRCLEDSPSYLEAIHYYLLLLVMSIWNIHLVEYMKPAERIIDISDKNKQHIPKWTNETRSKIKKQKQNKSQSIEENEATL